MTVKKANKAIFKRISMELIDRPEEISRMDIDLDRIRELAASIKERGLLQPILVHPKGNRYGIIAGDRRYMAHEMLGEKGIMCRIRDISGKEVKIDRAVENLQREDLTPFEEGFIYKGLVDKEGMSVEEISKLVSKSPGVVERRMSILKMPETFQKAIHSGAVSMTVAEELWGTPDTAKREYFLNMAIEHGITKEVARDWVSEYRKEKRTGETSGKSGGSAALAFEDVPIYRACDVCHGPCSYSDIVELRVCPGCGQTIKEAIQTRH